MLENKVIYLYSPQAWGKMRLSKHHYAIELINRGNTVYYIETPENKNRGVSIEKADGFEKLFIVKSGLKGIRNRHVRIKLPALFDHLVKKNTKKIQKAINKQADIVWSFDLNGYIGVNLFPDAIKIAQPVDFVAPYNHKRAKAVDFIFSVAEEILEPLKGYCPNASFINHGVSQDLISVVGDDNITSEIHSKTRVGYVGNLLRNDINHELILKLIRSNQNFDFLFMGNYKPSNISADIEESSQNFINRLSSLPNVALLGVLNTQELADKLREVDAFIICYDEKKDMCKGTNYHKVLEFVATGKVLISNYVSTYKTLDLFEMTSKGNSIKEFESLFNKVTDNLEHYNSESYRRKRIDFAMQHTYKEQILKIDNILQGESS